MWYRAVIGWPVLTRLTSPNSSVSWAYFMSGPSISTFLPTPEVSATAGLGGTLTSSCHF